ncbi:endonuclease/exonuclease/phosphatase family protein [Actinoplanes sp. NPDC049265]|uniref:endonuclease/exonuclease/phosphatase family protein n=1 Tax=Actinoplanes sp. NPDC049265 TaxID=3363902 RepID=UPI0037186458
MTITSARPSGTARRHRKRAGVTVLVWLLLLPTAVWSVLRFGGWESGALVQLFAFTTYAAAWSAVPALIALLTRRWLGAAVAVVATALLVVAILPRVLTDRDTGPATGVPLRIMSSNVELGGADADALVKLVREQDVAVLALQEFTPSIQGRLEAAGLTALLPYSSVAARWGASGSAVYSRFPVTAPGARRNGGGFWQAYATITPPGAGPIVVESAHPLAPYAVDVLDSWRGDLAAEPRTGPNGPPRVLLGDFNSTLDHHALRELIARGGYRDAAAATGQGLVGTWGPYGGAPLPPVTIDHVLVDKRIGVRDVRVHGVPRTDHRSIYASLTVPAA